ncbi:LacI family DNA-binding transcriptional regulator [Fulvivirgaceae bacterium BMA12]|uniref:LacI family DNA-binding transcriptional regulator n=1 Tax=Agaribacillus aureus TaxID=3051825 RepID=A0ABT8L5H6_9BACT|nr:LacI family DNA-binding transcriptional regulator [Fulvivirgaceae bacterium BMA12]
MKKKKVSIYDIANRLEISSSTVSRALNDHARISEKTKLAVRRVAKELGFEKNHLASGLITNKSFTISIIVPAVNRNFFASAITGIEKVASENGYTVLICQSHDQYEREVKLIDTLIINRVDGIIASLAINTEEFDHFRKAKNAGIPVVFFDRVCHEIEDTFKIVVNDFNGAYLATRHLAEQGFKRIAHIGGYQSQNIFRERLAGYKKGLSEFNLPFDEGLVRYCALNTDDGTKLTEELLQLKPRPDAIFCANNLTAISALAYAMDHNIKVPEALGIVGFSEETVSSLLKPAITSIRQPSEQMGKLAAQKLLEEIDAESSDNMDYTEIELRTELIVRASSKLE